MKIEIIDRSPIPGLKLTSEQDSEVRLLGLFFGGTLTVCHNTDGTAQISLFPNEDLSLRSEITLPPA